MKLTSNLPSLPRRFVRRSLALLGIFVCLCGMSSVGRGGLARLLMKRGLTTQQLAPLDEAVRQSDADPAAHHARALVLAELGREDEAAPEFERAVALCPNDYYLWLEAGQAREEREDMKGARAAFTEAIRLAPSYAQPHWQLGNFLLRTAGDDPDAAFREMRRAAASDAQLFPALIDLAWGAYEADAQAVLNATEPQTDAARLRLARFFATHRETGAALNLFRTVKVHVQPEERSALVGELLAAGAVAGAREVWAAGRGEGGDHESGDNESGLFDGGFEREIKTDETGFGWRPFRGAQTIQFGLDARAPHSGQRSLRLEYRGGFDPATPIISQLVSVKPRTRYQLSFAARTEDLVSAALPSVVLKVNDGTGHLLAQAQPLPRGTSDAWQTYTIDFVAPDDARLVSLCIQRLDCHTSPCPIFGRAWFDDFMLEER